MFEVVSGAGSRLFAVLLGDRGDERVMLGVDLFMIAREIGRSQVGDDIAPRHHPEFEKLDEPDKVVIARCTGYHHVQFLVRLGAGAAAGKFLADLLCAGAQADKVRFRPAFGCQPGRRHLDLGRQPTGASCRTAGLGP